MVHNIAFMVEEKTQYEQESTQTKEGKGANEPHKDSEVIDLDDTEDFRTVIVNTEENKDAFERF